jgi:SAM-dependent MidA family methyltransferase
MSSEEMERRIEFIIEQQANFSTDIEQLKEVQARQAENLSSLAETVAAMQVEMREGFNNLIVANEVTRKLTEDVARLALVTSRRVTKLEE